jgi:transposase
MSSMESKQPLGKPRRSFTDEFKRDAIDLVVVENRRIADVARSLAIGDSTLGRWVQQARIDAGDRDGVTTSEREELVVLRRENKQLRMERDLLKRATVFWVKESGQ